MADQDELALAFMGLKSPPDTSTDLIEPDVIVLTGGSYLKGEKSIIRGKHYTLDLPTKEVVGYKFMTNGGGNMLTQLKKSLGNLDGGPWTVQGRDGELTIKNRNYNQKPIAKFTFREGHGELLSFNARTTRTEKTLDATTSSDVNPDDKTVTTVSTQATSKETTSPGVNTPGLNQPESVTVNGKRYFKPMLRQPINNGDINSASGEVTKSGKKIIHAQTPEVVKAQNKNIDLNYKPSKEDSEKYLSELRKKYTDLMSKIKNGDANALVDILDVGDLGKFIVKRKTWVTKWVNPTSYWQNAMGTRGVDDAVTKDISSTGSSNYYNRWELGYSYLKSQPNIRIVEPNRESRPSTSIDGYGPEANVGGGGGMVQIAEYVEVEVPIDGARMLTSIQPPASMNEVVKSFQEEITGTFRIIGHPEIGGEKIIQIDNVSARYSGDWFIKNIKHRVDASGYFCEGQIIKKGSTIVTNTVVSNSNMKGVYAKLAKLAQAHTERDKAGINLDTIIKNSVEEFRKNEEAAGRKVSPDASFGAIIPDSYGMYTGKTDFPIPVYQANSVNINKSREKLKKQAQELLKPKQ